MNGPELHRRAAEVFTAALALARDDVDAYLDRACAGDAALRREVASLLIHDGAPSPLLETWRAAGAPANGSAAWNPATIGGYRVLGRIGEGSTGTVFEAEQGAPRRRVALKALRPWIVSETSLRRFRREAAALGRLAHPGVARVYEAGMAEDLLGRFPFFTMELVDGPSLTRYAREKKLGVRARLELMADVCDAVQHAHGAGIVHRDLKPSNILVDPSGRARVLDFGVARMAMTDGGATRWTMTGEIVGTIAYMSPEQADGSPDEVDARSDVYSLGAILFELLAGRPAFDPSDTPLPEALRLVRDRPAPRLGDLDRRLRGDLEAVVSRAMDADRSRRYPSADALAADLRRHLRNEPVLARAPSRAYRLARFCRRNRAFLLAVAIVMLALLGGLGAALWQASRAEQSAARAVAELDAIQRLIKGPNDAPWDQRDVLVSQLLLRARGGMADFSHGDMRLEADLDVLVGNCLMNVNVTGPACELFQAALEIRRDRLGAGHPETLMASSRVASAALECGRLTLAERHALAYVEGMGRIGGGDPQQLLKAWTLLAQALERQGRHAEAIGACERGRRALRNVKDEWIPKLFKTRIGLVLAAAGRPGDAMEYVLDGPAPGMPDNLLSMQAELLQRLARAHLGDDPDLALNLSRRAGRMYAASRTMRGSAVSPLRSLAGRWWLEGRYDLAEPVFRDALEACRRSGMGGAAEADACINSLGVCLRDACRYEEAEPLLREALAMRRVRTGADSRAVADSEVNLALLLCRTGRAAEAEALAAHALPVRAGASGDGSAPVIEALALLGLSRAMQGDCLGGLMLSQEALARRERLGPEPDWRTDLAVEATAEALVCAGRLDEARQLVVEEYARACAGSGDRAAIIRSALRAYRWLAR